MPGSNKDKRGRVWEIFCDLAYYDMWCVRVADDRSFDSQLSFHFITKDEADKFLELVLKSS